MTGSWREEHPFLSGGCACLTSAAPIHMCAWLTHSSFSISMLRVHVLHSRKGLGISICEKASVFQAPLLCTPPRSGELRMQKLKSHLVRTQSLNVLPLKPWVGQYISINAMLTAKDTLPIHSSAFCPKPLQYFQCWLWLTHGSCADRQNKTGHPAGCRFLCWVPTEYK